MERMKLGYMTHGQDWTRVKKIEKGEEGTKGNREKKNISDRNSQQTVAIRYTKNSLLKEIY